MSEVAIYEPGMLPDRVIQRSGGVFERDIIDGWVQVLADVQTLANFIAETDFVPKALRNRPAAIAACILTGRELGIGPMQSLKSIYMVQGIPSLSAEYKRARALAAGHDITIDETTATRCIIRGRRAGSDRWVTITWTMDMANRAKLAGKDIWRMYPQRMLQARASGELCDLLFPDASLGLATTEVLEDGGIIAENGQLVDAATGEVTSSQAPAIEAPKRTAQRATRQRAEPRPAPAAPAAAPAPTSAPAPAGTAPSGDGLPPLPGEDEVPTSGGAATSDTAPPSGGDSGEPVNNKRLTAIWTTLTKDFEVTSDDGGKEEARAACGIISGRGANLGSTKLLTNADASVVLDTLAHLKAQSERNGESPRTLLLELLAEREEGAGGGD